MKTQMSSHALPAAFLLLLGISAVEAANIGICSQTALATGDVCQCPGGTGAPAGAGYNPSVAGINGVITATGAVTDPVSKCVNLIPGYEIASAATIDLTPVAALTPGITALQPNSFVVAADTVSKITISAGKITALVAAPATACPTGIGNTLTAGAQGVNALTFATACVDLLPGYVFKPGVASTTSIAALLEVCTAGNYQCAGKANIFKAFATGAQGVTGITNAAQTLVVTGADAIGPTVSLARAAKPAGTFFQLACPYGSSTTAVQAQGATNTACLVSSGFFIDTRASIPEACPPGLTCNGGGAVGTAGGLDDGLCTSTQRLPNAGDKCQCPGGTAATSGTPATITAAIVGTNIYATVTATAATTNPLAACVDLMPGYEVKTAVASATITPALTLTAGITAVDDNTWIIQTPTKVTISNGKITAITKTLATKCPVGVGNTVTGLTASGQNAISYAAACVDVLPLYRLKSGATSATIGNFLVACSAGMYCPGISNVFNNAVPLGTGSGVSTVNRVVNALTTITAAVTTTDGTLTSNVCPTGSSNTAAGNSIASCLVKGGYYIDVSDVNTPVICPKGNYCLGGGAVGTAGGDLNCPHGSATLVASAQNSRLDDCALSAGFYIATGALGTPVPCLKDTICDGGGPVGTVGGSVACPVDSLNAACAGGSSSTSTTVNLTPASQPITVDVDAPAAVAPDVSVTNTVPSASSASTNVAGMALMAVSAFMVAF